MANALRPKLHTPPPRCERILMCPPDFFQVEYAINPWMNTATPVDPGRARAQWESLCAALEPFSELEILPPAAHVPDLVFCANSAFVFENKAVLARFRHPERTPEESINRMWFEGHGFEVVELPPGLKFEGTGDALFHRGPDILWCGHGWRTSAETPGHLAELLQLKVVPLELTRDKYYHLDTCFVPLPGGGAYYHPAAFTPEGLRTIAEFVPERLRIEVGPEDAARFACNAVWFSEAVIINDCSRELERQLNRLGFEVIRVDLSEFMLSGGAAGCLTLYLQEMRTRGARQPGRQPARGTSRAVGV